MRSSAPKMEFMLVDKRGELFVAGMVGVRNGQVSPVVYNHEIPHNVRTHEMSEFKILGENKNGS